MFYHPSGLFFCCCPILDTDSGQKINDFTKSYAINNRVEKRHFVFTFFWRSGSQKKTGIRNSTVDLGCGGEMITEVTFLIEPDFGTFLSNWILEGFFYKPTRKTPLTRFAEYSSDCCWPFCGQPATLNLPNFNRLQKLLWKRDSIFQISVLLKWILRKVKNTFTVEFYFDQKISGNWNWFHRMFK